MDHYTEFLREQIETLSPDDEDYEIRLREIADSFRGYGEALSDFIVGHGYTEDIADVEAKAKFIREKFKMANMKSPRDIKKWFAPKMKPTRDTIFQICFAFGLDVDETNDFFRCVYFDRGFDCHTISEAVYYFCVKNDLTYRNAQDIIRQMPTQEKIKTVPSQQGIDALMRGELKDNDLIRKMLVLLVFYTYWAKLIIWNKDELYLKTDADSERCFDTMNQYLLDAGYQELYAGNPYDWIFMWALNNENPLWAFRFFIGKVFAAKEEEAGAGD